MREEEEIRADLEQLLHSWDVLLRRSRVGRGPNCCTRELDLAIRLIRDYAPLQPPAYHRGRKKHLSAAGEEGREGGVSPIQGKGYRGKEDHFPSITLRKISRAFPTGWYGLPGGGYLVFDYTEAMTVIDVNSGKFASAADRDSTSMVTNREAARESPGSFGCGISAASLWRFHRYG